MFSTGWVYLCVFLKLAIIELLQCTGIHITCNGSLNAEETDTALVIVIRIL